MGSLFCTICCTASSENNDMKRLMANAVAFSPENIAIIQYAYNLFDPPHIINQSFLPKLFPKCWLMFLNVTPLHKNGNGLNIPFFLDITMYSANIHEIFWGFYILLSDTLCVVWTEFIEGKYQTLDSQERIEVTDMRIWIPLPRYKGAAL